MKHSTLLLSSLCLLSACSSASNTTAQAPQTLSLYASPQSQQQRALVSYARQYLGTRYVWGGTSPKGFDCSGYIQYVYRHFDIDVPRTTASYPTMFDQAVPITQAKVGDLIVFTGTDPSTRRPGHAGIITQVGKGKLHFIHSSSSKRHFGVTETDYYNSGYPKRFLKVVRIQS
ncbi:C40 family peptidase [Vibrio sp. AK197]